MNTPLMGRIPWLNLGMLWLVYVLLGWQLAAHHILWVVGAALIAATLLLIGRDTLLFKQLLWFGSQGLSMTVGISLLIAIGITLFATDFQFLGLIVLPVVTMLWADLGMRMAEFKPRQVLVCLAAIATLGIVCGETIDLFLIPSMRY